MDMPERDIYTVSRLNRETRQLLEGNFPLLWLEGEISNLATPGSGHWYFTLKDEQAQVRAAMFRNRNSLLDFMPEPGMMVLVRARISLYEARGDFQLIIEHMEEAGDGALQRAFEALKRRLDAEGLFASRHKRPLPPWPARIGIVTSPTGAAIRDIVSVFRRRFPAIELTVYPTAVQGEDAAYQIAAAIETANRRNEVDALIVARGGGSLEDLWCFNTEVVARAIFASHLPVVTGIGHEVDVTIADLVADQRAATPSAAAELLSPDASVLQRRIETLAQRLLRRIDTLLREHARHLDWLRERLRRQHPVYRLQQQFQHLDELSMRLSRACRHRLAERQARLAALAGRLQRHHPGARIAHAAGICRQLQQRLNSAMHNRLRRQEDRLAALSRELHSLSPLATLDRGYAIVRHDDRVIDDAARLAPGDRVVAQLARGSLACTVDSVTPARRRNKR